MPGRPGSHAVRYATPGGVPVRSIGGMTLTPDCDTETLPDDCAGLILVGGMSWATPEAERIVPLVREALSHGILVGAICNAASFLAAHGFLNGVRHTRTASKCFANGAARTTRARNSTRSGGRARRQCRDGQRLGVSGIHARMPARARSRHAGANRRIVRLQQTRILSGIDGRSRKNTSTIFRNPRRSCCTNSTARPTCGPWRRG